MSSHAACSRSFEAVALNRLTLRLVERFVGQVTAALLQRCDSNRVEKAFRKLVIELIDHVLAGEAWHDELDLSW